MKTRREVLKMGVGTVAMAVVPSAALATPKQTGIKICVLDVEGTVWKDITWERLLVGDVVRRIDRNGGSRIIRSMPRQHPDFGGWTVEVDGVPPGAGALFGGRITDRLLRTWMMRDFHPKKIEVARRYWSREEGPEGRRIWLRSKLHLLVDGTRFRFVTVPEVELILFEEISA